MLSRKPRMLVTAVDEVHRLDFYGVCPHLLRSLRFVHSRPAVLHTSAASFDRSELMILCFA